jgi:hypothetical protein
MELRAAVEWLAREADGDDELADPPYQSGFYENWTVVDPAGESREIGAPRVDFARGEIEWR